MNFRPLRREKQALSHSECLAILKKCPKGTLALIGDGGWPYAVPVDFTVAPSGDRIWIHGAPFGHKYESVLKDGRASLAVVAKDEVRPEIYATSYESVIVFGRARVLETWEEKLEAIRALCDELAPGRPEDRAKEIEAGKYVAVIELPIEHMTGKMSLDLAKARGAVP